MSDISKIERPLLRMSYKHVSGDVYVVWGVCKPMSTKVCGDMGEIVILANLKDGTPEWCALDKFWDKHPQTQEPRFQLVTPVPAQ